MATTRTRRTFNSTKSSSSKSSSIPKSTTKYTASGQDYSSTGNAKADAINLAKANAISAKKSASRGEAYDPSVFEADMGENPITAPGALEQPEVSPVKTEQPSPETAKVQAPSQEVPYEQAIANLNAGGGSPELIANATNVLKQKYGRGLEADMATGTEAAQDTQAGLGAVSKYAPPTAPDTSQEQLNVESLLQQDKGWQELQTLYDNYEDQTKRKDSFVKEYEKLYKASGIEGIETEMINISNAINGSEADIQLEIQKAGGFGTTSQVMALAAARNKTLLQQYNGLTALAEMKESKLNTMLGLMEKDRQYAEQRFERMVNMKQKEIEYRQKFENNIKENYRNQFQLLGADGMYQAYSQSPNQLAIAERMMGLSTGQLAIAAQRAQEDRQLELDDKALDREYKEASIRNINSTIEERNEPTGEDDISAYVTAYQTGQIPLTQVPAKIRGQVLAEVQASGKNKMLDLLGQYRDKLEGTNFFAAQTPSNRAIFDTLKGQITAEYKQQKQLGTLDAGVQKLIDSIIPDPSKPSVSSLSNKAQVDALDNFIMNQGGGQVAGASVSVPAGTVAVKSKTGQIGYVPEDELDEALSEGYTKI